MPSVNERAFDAAVRHSVFLSRFGGGAARRVLAILDEADRALTPRLAARIERLGPLARQAAGRGGVTSRRLDAMIKDIRAQSNDLRSELLRAHKGELRELAGVEVDIASRHLDEAIGVNLNNFRPSPELLRAIVDGRTIRGQTIARGWRDLTARRFLGLDSAVRLGIVEGDTTPQIIRRVRDQMRVGRRAAEALVRTSVNAVANQARDLLFQANRDIIKGWVYTATLDGRTSRICSALSGKKFPIGEGPRPPRHPNCRSIQVPIVKSWDELARPGALKRGRGAGNIDTLFAKQLKAKGFTPAQVKTTKRNQQASMNGAVPAELNYQEWLKRQPETFIVDVLGPTKARLFLDGKVDLDKFVDLKTSRPFTLDELRAKEGAAFERAGLAA